MNAAWLLSWWNVIFVVPFLLAVLYLFVYAASGLTFGEAGADHDVGADADADGDLHAGVDADADADAGDGGAGDPHPSLQAAALSWLGIGRVPLSILLMVLLMTWGAAGFVANQVARDLVRRDWQVSLVSLPLAAAVALLVTRVLVRSIDRWLPLHQTTAKRRHDLLGEAGVAIYAISDRFGMVSVRDANGDLYHMPCRMEPGRPPVDKGAKVILTGYSARSKSYYVIPADAVPAAAAGGSDNP